MWLRHDARGPGDPELHAHSYVQFHHFATESTKSSSSKVQASLQVDHAYTPPAWSTLSTLSRNQVLYHASIQPQSGGISAQPAWNKSIIEIGRDSEARIYRHYYIMGGVV